MRFTILGIVCCCVWVVVIVVVTIIVLVLITDRKGREGSDWFVKLQVLSTYRCVQYKSGSCNSPAQLNVSIGFINRNKV